MYIVPNRLPRRRLQDEAVQVLVSSSTLRSADAFNLAVVLRGGRGTAAVDVLARFGTLSDIFVAEVRALSGVSQVRAIGVPTLAIEDVLCSRGAVVRRSKGCRRFPSCRSQKVAVSECSRPWPALQVCAQL